jgi:hypothetical protein
MQRRSRRDFLPNSAFRMISQTGLATMSSTALVQVQELLALLGWCSKIRVPNGSMRPPTASSSTTFLLIVRSKQFHPIASRQVKSLMSTLILLQNQWKNLLLIPKMRSRNLSLLIPTTRLHNSPQNLRSTHPRKSVRMKLRLLLLWAMVPMTKSLLLLHLGVLVGRPQFLITIISLTLKLTSSPSRDHMQSLTRSMSGSISAQFEAVQNMRWISRM